MELKRYQALLRHDHGEIKLSTFATSEDAARKIICEAEGCPERAVKFYLSYADFKETLRPYEIEGGFGVTLETGFEMYYGVERPVKFKAKSMQKAYQMYLRNL